MCVIGHTTRFQPGCNSGRAIAPKLTSCGGNITSLQRECLQGGKKILHLAGESGTTFSGNSCVRTDLLVLLVNIIVVPLTVYAPCLPRSQSAKSLL